MLGWSRITISKIYFLLMFCAFLCIHSSYSFEPIEKARVEIDRLEIVGVTVIEQSLLESVLEIDAGDVFERVKVRRTQDNLQGLYQTKGYEEVQVRSELIRHRSEDDSIENVLKISVKEGSPTRINSIRLLPQQIKGGGFQKYWKKIEKTLIDLIGLPPGSVFDQEKISVGKRAIQDFLASEEYVGAKVNDVRIQTSSKISDSRWVDLELQIELGDRVTFGFRGNLVFNRTRLDALIEEQRLIGFGQDYVSSIAHRIEEEYKLAGYANCAVVPYTFERSDQQERHVTYVVQEGTKIKIESLDFDGNIVFSDEELRQEFYLLSSPFIQRQYYVEKEISKSADLLVEWLKSQGYLSAKLITISRVFVPKKSAYKLVFYLYEGDQTTVQNIQLQGVTAFSKDEVLKILGVKTRFPLNLYYLNEGLEALKSVYRSRGYLSMTITNEEKETIVQYTNENRNVSLLIEVNEGPQFRAGRIVIEGLSRTREEVVRRQLLIHEGDILEELKISDSEAQLRKLGIFSSIIFRLDEDPAQAGFKTIRILLQEGTPGIIAGGVGYRNDLGFRVFGQTAYTNLWRRNHTLLFNANLNRRFDESFCANEDKFGIRHGGTCFLEYVAELGYVWPWFAFGDTVFHPKFTVENTQYRSLDAFTISFTSTLERKLVQSPNLIGALTYSLERTEQYNSQSIIDNQKHVIGALIPSFRLDLRDNSLAPTAGLFSLVSYEIANPAFLSQGDPFPIAYTRFQWRNDGFIPLGSGITWFLSFRTGFERNLVKTPSSISEDDEQARRFAIPLIKQFSLGGAGSVRGFGEQKINRNELAIRGTLSFVNYRTQIDFPFAGAVRFGPFLDAANLLDNRFSFGILRYGAGFGFHYLSPIGPINFDMGFNLFPQTGEDPSQFHFSIGVI